MQGGGRQKTGTEFQGGLWEAATLPDHGRGVGMGFFPCTLDRRGMTSKGSAVSSSEFCSHRASAVTRGSLTAVRAPLPSMHHLLRAAWPLGGWGVVFLEHRLLPGLRAALRVPVPASRVEGTQTRTVSPERGCFHLLKGSSLWSLPNVLHADSGGPCSQEDSGVTCSHPQDTLHPWA